MCGICGKLNFDRQEPVNIELLHRMMNVIKHRGPDGEGTYRSGSVGLGHRRLSIIDLSTGDQPMCNEDGTVWVVYNGEIYNFTELRDQLISKGHKFKTTSDTEVIVHLYEEIGEDCVRFFSGMFAFAVWDERLQLLLLARDRVGIKPLYYANTGKALIFGSEIKSILVDKSIRRDVNLCAVDRFITFNYLPGNETLFKGIYKLEPGHYLKVHEGNTSIRQYWDIKFDVSNKWRSLEEAAEALRSLLRQTVYNHMISDVQVGILLSGGVDSTGILRYAVEKADKPLSTFTIGFDRAEFADERPYALMAAKKYGTKHYEITMTANEFRDFLPRYIWHMEEPVCEPPAVALFFVSRLAREKSIKVLLSGEGGDEAFGGYQNYRNISILELLKSTFGKAKKVLKIGFGAIEKSGLKNIEKYKFLVDRTLEEYYLSRTATPNNAFNRIKKSLYSSFLTNSINMKSSGYPTGKYFLNVNDQHLLNQMLYVDTKTWLPDDLLLKADKMTMATSVELRVPILDFQILEFAASLPPSYKVLGWSTKRILKTALKDSVPEKIIHRKKTGFPVPYAGWLRRELKDYVHETIISQKSCLRCYFENKIMVELLDRFQSGEDLSAEVFSLLILELWHQQFEPSFVFSKA